MAVETGTVPGDWHDQDPGDIATVISIINERNKQSSRG